MMTREVDGIVLLNKPLGMTSQQALQRVKRLYQARKAGHTGSLDPLATGLLPICLGRATRIAQRLLDADKRYVVECLLGTVTTTGDAEGKIVAVRPVNGLTEREIAAVLQHYRGTLLQTPPMYSALKYHGQPLYRLARRGQVVDRPPREITIYALTMLRFEPERLTLEVHCSKGTYIRTLVENLGDTLGCGASVSALHRTASGPFSEMIDFSLLEQTATQGLTALDALLRRHDNFY